MKTYEILEAAKAKIIDPANWIKGYYAKDADGNELLGNEPGAVCFCGYGAIEAVTKTVHKGNGWPNCAEQALDDAVGENFANYNDEHTHAEVLAAFDKAIAGAKAAN